MAGADDEMVDFFSQSPTTRLFSQGASSSFGGGGGSGGAGEQGAGGVGGDGFDLNSQADGYPEMEYYQELLQSEGGRLPPIRAGRRSSGMPVTPPPINPARGRRGRAAQGGRGRGRSMRAFVPPGSASLAAEGFVPGRDRGVAGRGTGGFGAFGGGGGRGSYSGSSGRGGQKRCWPWFMIE
ncbi:spidroin-1-like [Oryza brachyantha]|uniref:spidroin-1-like n=1 Tax=Oryza brachyantha TaxID=4533 RepID=UPI0003EA7F19|nr:spidroin-1-like [Oryza brachyantha]